MHAPTESPAVIEADTFDHHDRTQAILAKYNLDIEQPRWPSHPFPALERVTKPIRMRVRYTCHRCKTSFGHDKECISCRHRRCAKCDRYPARKPKPGVGLQTMPAALVDPVEKSVPETEAVAADHMCACHECQTFIEMTIEECPNCHHAICDRCHKEARMQSVDERGTEEASKQEEEGARKAPPGEQKLPPDISTKEEQEPAVS